MARLITKSSTSWRREEAAAASLQSSRCATRNARCPVREQPTSCLRNQHFESQPQCKREISSAAAIMAPATSRSASSSRSSSSAKAGPSSSSSKPAPQRSSSALRLSNAPPPPPPAAKQGKLAFTRLSGPVPSPPKKKVRIHAPEKDEREAKGKGKAPARDLEDDDDGNAADLWSSQYRPTSRAQLAIHPRKIDDVEQWLREAFSASPWLRNRRRILLLRGPAGAAKTETIRQLSAATELDFEVLEWKTSEAAGTGGGPSDWREGLNEGIMDRFREFISKSAKFPTLALATQDGRRASSPTSSAGSSSTSRTRRQIILLEDLPTLSHYPTLQAFHDIIATFLAQSPRSDGGNVPLVIILSDTASSTSGSDGNDGGSLEDRSSDDAWMRTRKLLGEEAVAMSDRWHEIKFNLVAITILARVLKETYERAIGHPLPAPIKSKSKPAPPSHKAMPVEIVETLAESSLGDVRSAIDLLQQAHQRFVKKPRRFEKVAQSRTKTKAKEEARKLMVELGLMSRESALDLFHALGKLMFNKRVGDPAEKRRRGEEEVESDEDEDDDEEGVKMGERKKRPLPLPKHLAHLERRKSKVNVEVSTARATQNARTTADLLLSSSSSRTSTSPPPAQA